MSLIVLAASAADEAPKKQATKEEIRARLAEHARKKSAESSAATDAPTTKAVAPISPTAAPVATGKSDKAPTKVSPPADSPEVLPKVEVRKERITELDRQVDKQNREIAREKKNTKPTPLDEALNGPKTSKVLAIFGGQSSDDRSAVAQERVSMMEEERDLIEAIAQAPTKEEKEQLQKTLDSMKAIRRELEQSLR
jgi:hypothetical protein